MDDKVLKLIDRAINEGLSYGEVESIMAFNGYDQLSIDQALSDIKKKRPEFVSDVPSTSEQVDSGAFNVPTSNLESTDTSDSELVPDDLTKADFVNNREPLMNFADQQAQTAQDLNDRLKSADPDPLNFFEKSAKRIGGFVRGSSTPGGLGFGVELGNINVEVERAKQEKELEQDIEYQKSRRDDRVAANAALNDHFGFDYNLYEEDEQGILRPNPEKRKQVDDYLGGMNAQADFIRNQVGIEDAINAEATKNKLPGFTQDVYDRISAPVLSSMNFGTSTAINLYGTVMDAIGAPESYAGRAKTSIAEGRATAQLRAGLDPKDTRSFTELFQDGEIGKGALSLGLTMAEQFPQIAMTIMAPEVGLAVGGVSAGTASYMDVRNRLDMTVSDKVTTTVVSAASEYLFEKITMTDIRLARKALGIDEAIDVAGAGAKKTARTKALKELRKQSKMRPFVQTGEQFLSEGLEEVGVELTNGVLAYMISGEVTDPRDVLESFIIGGIMGGGTVAVPQMLASGMNGMASIANMKEFKNVSDEIQSLNAKLKDNMSEYDRQKITDRIVELGQKQRNIAAASMPIYAAMPKEAQETMRQIHKDMSTALNSYYSLSDADAKKNQLNVIRDLIKDKNVMEEEYAGRAITAQEHSPKNIKINEEYTEELNDSVEYEDGQVKAENGITKSEASAMSRIFGIVKGKGKAKVVVHNSLRSLMNSDSQARKLFRESKGKTRGVAYVKTEKGGKKTIHVLSPQAFRLYNQHAGTDRSAGKTYAHEVLHTAISEMLTTDPVAQERLFAEIEKEAAAGNVFAREALKFSEKYTDEKGFDENTRKNETLTEFLALMTRGNNLESLRRDTPKLLDRIKNLINDFLISAGYTDIKIQDDADLFTVAKNLSDAMRLGSTVQFGRDIQQDKVAKAKAKRAKAEPTTTEAPVPLAADIDTENSIDDIVFTLIADEYDPNTTDQDRVDQILSLAGIKDVGDAIDKNLTSFNDQEILGLNQIAANALSQSMGFLSSSLSVQKANDLKTENKTREDLLDQTIEDLQNEYYSAVRYDREPPITSAEKEDLRNSLLVKIVDAAKYHSRQLAYQLRIIESSMPVFKVDKMNTLLAQLNKAAKLNDGDASPLYVNADFVYDLGRNALDRASTAYGILQEQLDKLIIAKEVLAVEEDAKEPNIRQTVEAYRKEIAAFTEAAFKRYDKSSLIPFRSYPRQLFSDVLYRHRTKQDHELPEDLRISNYPILKSLVDVVNRSGFNLGAIDNYDELFRSTGITQDDGSSLMSITMGLDPAYANDRSIAHFEMYKTHKKLDPTIEITDYYFFDQAAQQTFNDQVTDLGRLLPLQPQSDMITEKLFLDSALMKSLNPETLKMKSASIDQWMKYFSQVKGGSVEAETINLRGFLEQYILDNPGAKSIPFAAIQNYVKDNAIEVSVDAPLGMLRWAEAYYDPKNGVVVIPDSLGPVATDPALTTPTLRLAPDELEFDGTHSYPMKIEEVMDIEFIEDDGNYIIEVLGTVDMPDGDELYAYMSIDLKDIFDGNIDDFVLGAIEEAYEDGEYEGLEDEITPIIEYNELNSINPRDRFDAVYEYQSQRIEDNDEPDPQDVVVKSNSLLINVGTGLTRAEAMSLARISPEASGLGRHKMYSIVTEKRHSAAGVAGTNYSEILIQHPEGFLKQTDTFRNNTHFSEANVISFIRSAEATAADGGRVLLLDEVQSDWGQSARKEGMSANPLQEDNQKLNSLTYDYQVYQKAHEEAVKHVVEPRSFTVTQLLNNFSDRKITADLEFNRDESYDRWAKYVDDLNNYIINNPLEAFLVSLKLDAAEGAINQYGGSPYQILYDFYKKAGLNEAYLETRSKNKKYFDEIDNTITSLRPEIKQESEKIFFDTNLSFLTKTVLNYNGNRGGFRDLAQTVGLSDALTLYSADLSNLTAENIESIYKNSSETDLTKHSWEFVILAIDTSVASTQRNLMRAYDHLYTVDIDYYVGSRMNEELGSTLNRRVHSILQDNLETEKTDKITTAFKEYQEVIKKITPETYDQRIITRERIVNGKQNLKDLHRTREQLVSVLSEALPSLGINIRDYDTDFNPDMTYRSSETVLEDIESTFDSTFHKEVSKLSAKEVDTLINKIADDQRGVQKMPYTPYGNRTDDWAGMSMRVAAQLGAKGGFDYVAWVPGYFQKRRWGRSGEGPAKFYDDVLPGITQKQIKRFDNKNKVKPIEIFNRFADPTSGAFQALGFSVTDKTKKFFEDGNATSFTLDTDFAADVPDVTKENPITIINALSFADQAAIPTNVEFKEALTKMLHEDPRRDEIINKYGLTLQKGPDGLMHYAMDQALMNYLTDAFELETLVAMKAYPDAIGWYDETVTKAMTVVELIYPEIKADKDLAAIMKMAVAISSNGLKVKQNFALAIKQYEYFRENGKFNPELVEGAQGGSMSNAFAFINEALDIMSIENFVEFLVTPVRNGDMSATITVIDEETGKEKKQKQNLSPQYPVDHMLFGAAIFGPKIGNGFFMNLMGEFQTLTIDRWLTRQFGRLRGDLLIARSEALTKSGEERFIKALTKLRKSDRKKLGAMKSRKKPYFIDELFNPAFDLKKNASDLDIDQLSRKVASATANKDRLAVLQSTPQLDELRKAARNHVKNLKGEKEAPSTGTERVFMETVFKDLQNRLFSKYGISITIADLQAVNWYPEKALYQTFQAKNSISSAKDFTSEEEKPDYFSGASEVAREKGIKQKDIDNAIEQLDFRHESVRQSIAKGNESFGTANQEADLEGVRKAINQVRAGQEVTSTFFHLDEEFNNYSLGSRLGDVEYSSMQPHVVQAKTYLERRMNENPVMELEGPKVIRHPGDIAFLLRHMESESSESTFLVVRDRNNPENYDVTYMTTGTVNSAMVDSLKVRQIVTNFQETYGVDVDAEVTLVHNHPSGSLRASDGDLGMHETLLKLFDKDPNVRVGNSVIINLDSGQYVEFDKGQLGSSPTFQSDFTTLQKYEKQTGFKNVKVQNFNRQELFRPRTADKLQIKSSNYIPKFLSHFKVSDTTKLGYIAMNQQNQITRIAVLDAAASAEDIGLMIERTIGKYGNNIILFGNDKPALKAVATASYQGLKAQTVNLLDVVHIEPGGKYKSGSDTGEMPGYSRFAQFTLEEVAEESMEGAMSIQESLAVTEMQAEQSPLYRERDIDLPNIDEINDVIQGHKAGKKILDENAPLSPGDLVGGRLNLNLLDAGQKKYGYRMSILSVHKPSNQKGKKYQEHNGVTTFAREKVVRNVDVMTLRNAYFNVNVKGSSEVGAMLHNRFVKKLDSKQIKELYPTAKNKFPLASVDGEYVDTPRENTNFDGVMIKYNPMASHMFMDVTGRPIKFAEEVTLIGDRAYARGKIEYAETAWDLHTVPGIGVEGFVVPTRVTTDPAKIEATHNQVMESGLQFSIDESGHESHNILDDQTLNMRRTAQRFANSLGDSEADVRKKIFDNPKNYINQQNLEAIKGNLEEMSDEDLIMIMTDNALVNLSLNPENGNDNIYVLAAIERINRMQANGEDTADAIEALAKVGTTVGRMLRHFAELKTSTPIGIVQMIESAMGKAGRRMTDAQRQNLMKIAQEFMDAQRALIDHQANFGTMDSAEFTKEFTKLSKALDNVTRTLNKITATLIPKRYSNLFGTFIKGNLMTPVSLVTNVVANIFEQGRFIIQRPIEGAIHFLSFKASRLVSKYLGKDVGVKEYYGREAGVTLLALPYAMKQGALGFAESIKGMFVKQGETQKIVHTGINPMFAMFAAVSDTRLGDYLKKVFKMDLINTDVLPRTKEGKVKPGDRVKLMIEGMFGIAPDIVFRALAVGDLPFSRFSGAFVVYNEAIKRFGRAAIDTDEFQNFLKYPPQDVVTKMSREGQRATFQEKNTASNAILQFRKIVEGKGTIPGRMMGFLFDSFMPYVKTPANIFVSTMKIAMPGVGAMSAMYNYSQGNHKKGNEDLSMAIVGTMMIKAADLLIAAGAIIGAFTDEDKEEKSLQYAYTGGPMRVNQTAIRRYLLSFNEEDLQFQEGDNWMKIDKSGIIGVVMGARATATKGLDHTAKSKKNIWYAPGEDSLFDTQFMINYFNPAMMTGTFKFINSMSFLQGANSLLSLIAGDEEGYEMQRNIDNWFRSVTSVALPNTISAFNRANRSHMPIFRNKDIARRMQYILLDKTFNVEGYPSRVDMVGRDILQTPEGKNPYYYHMFSVLKGQEVDPHPVIREYHRLMTATGDGSWLPSAPSKITSYYYSPTKTDLGSETYNEIVSMLGPGEKVKMRFEEKDLTRIQKMYYQDLTKNVESLMATDSYAEAQDDRKVELIQGVIADTRKMQYVVSRDPIFGSVKLKNEWYKEFLKLTVEGAKGLKEQLKESEE